MKKLSLIASTILLTSLSVSQVFADNGPGINSACPGGQFSGLCLNAQQLGPVIGSLITLLFVAVGLVALFFLIMGGFKWITSEGDKTNVEAARNQIVASIIGLIIVFLSYLLINILLGFLTGGKVSLLNLTLPTLPQSQ